MVRLTAAMAPWRLRYRVVRPWFHWTCQIHSCQGRRLMRLCIVLRPTRSTRPAMLPGAYVRLIVADRGSVEGLEVGEHLPAVVAAAVGDHPPAGGRVSEEDFEEDLSSSSRVSVC
jgi:hypothetical protein